MIRWVVPFVVVGCAGTDPFDGGQYGEENGARCEAQSRTALGPDETSALGFSPQDLLDLVGPAATVPLTWAGGGATDLSLEVAPDGARELVDYEMVVPDGMNYAATEMACADLVELEVAFGFVTADGVFDEVFATRLTSADAVSATVSASLDAVDGTFDAWDYAPAGNDWDEVRAWVTATWTADGGSGVVAGQGSGTDGDVAYAESLDIASWGAAED